MKTGMNMRYYLISNNIDTQMGLRLAGIEGVVVHTPEEVREALRHVGSEPDIGIVLITEMLAKLCPELINELKLGLHSPLLVEIPDRHGTGRAPDSIMSCVRDAVGIRI